MYPSQWAFQRPGPLTVQSTIHPSKRPVVSPWYLLGGSNHGQVCGTHGLGHIIEIREEMGGGQVLNDETKSQSTYQGAIIQAIDFILSKSISSPFLFPFPSPLQKEKA